MLKCSLKIGKMTPVNSSLTYGVTLKSNNKPHKISSEEYIHSHIHMYV